MPNAARSREFVTRVKKNEGRRKRKGDVAVGSGLDSLPGLIQGFKHVNKKPLALATSGGKKVLPQNQPKSLPKVVTQQEKSGKKKVNEMVVSTQPLPLSVNSNEVTSSIQEVTTADSVQESIKKRLPIPPLDGEKVVLTFGNCLACKKAIFNGYYGTHGESGTCSMACEEKFNREMRKTYL